jgi:DNA polymerase V
MIRDFVRPVEQPDVLFLPLFNSNIQAGFASPAEDTIDQYLDLNQLLIHNAPATFFVRVQGDSMLGAGIFPQDILIVDRSLKAKHNQVVLAVLNTEFTVKRYCNVSGKVVLVAENELYPPIKVKTTDEFEVWGVVTQVLHNPNA